MSSGVFFHFLDWLDSQSLSTWRQRKWTIPGLAIHRLPFFFFFLYDFLVQHLKTLPFLSSLGTPPYLLDGCHQFMNHSVKPTRALKFTWLKRLLKKHRTGCHLILSATLWDPMDCSPPGSSVHGILQGKNIGVGCHFLLQDIFPTQGLNLRLLHLLH